MKINYETLRDLYLKDLQLNDAYTGKPKVRHIDQWEKITPYVVNGNAITLDPLGDRNIYIWTDIHFGHTNIIKYCNRPYPNAKLMNECLIGNYFNIIKPNDIVIWGGDIGFMQEREINNILNRLPGYKIQIIGNHDMHRDGTLYELNFDERHLCMVVDVVDAEIEYQLLITHYPMDNVPPGTVNIHGHVHQHLMGAHNINCCVEHTNYAPMHFNKVLARAKQYINLHN